MICCRIYIPRPLGLVTWTGQPSPSADGSSGGAYLRVSKGEGNQSWGDLCLSPSRWNRCCYVNVYEIDVYHHLCMMLLKWVSNEIPKFLGVLFDCLSMFIKWCLSNEIPEGFTNIHWAPNANPLIERSSSVKLQVWWTVVACRDDSTWMVFAKFLPYGSFHTWWFIPRIVSGL